MIAILKRLTTKAVHNYLLVHDGDMSVLNQARHCSKNHAVAHHLKIILSQQKLERYCKTMLLMVKSSYLFSTGWWNFSELLYILFWKEYATVFCDHEQKLGRSPFGRDQTSCGGLCNKSPYQISDLKGEIRTQPRVWGLDYTFIPNCQKGWIIEPPESSSSQWVVTESYQTCYVW